MENLESRHRAIDRGNWVGIETVAGFAEGIVAGAWGLKLTKAGGSGEKVKDKEIVFGSRGCSEFKEFGSDGEGRVPFGTTE
jgi:hypothetical protein